MDDWAASVALFEKAVRPLTGTRRSSMVPALPPGHLLVFLPVNAGNLRPGDVNAYRSRTTSPAVVLITHRVVDVDSEAGHARNITVQDDAGLLRCVRFPRRSCMSPVAGQRMPARLCLRPVI